MPSGGARPGAGRKPKRPGLKLERGTKFIAGPRPDPTPAAEILAPGEGLPDNVPRGTMVAPADLGSEELRFFGELAHALKDQKRDSPHFEPVVTLAARRMAEVERLSAVIALEGDTFESRSIKKAGKESVITVMKRAHPAAAMRGEAMRHLQSLLGELMLSPLTALKLGTGKPATSDPFDF